MAQPYYETFQNIGNSGINVAFYTTPGGYRPLHWHEELEILYPLNGLSDITVEGTKFSLPKKQLMAIESMEVHSTFCYDQTLHVPVHPYSKKSTFRTACRTLRTTTSCAGRTW